MAKKGGLAADQLRSIIERVEKLEEEKVGIAADIREVFAEAKGNGFDVKAIRTIIKMRKVDEAEREEAETVLDTYLHALGMIPDFEEPELPFRTEQEPSDDELYEKAVVVVREHGRGSASLVQRSLLIGYNRAASLIERMEQEGIVSPANHVGKREVLKPDTPHGTGEGEAA